jgi:hypothetical protein
MFRDEGQMSSVVNRWTAAPLEHVGIVQVLAQIVAFCFDECSG